MACLESWPEAVAISRPGRPATWRWLAQFDSTGIMEGMPRYFHPERYPGMYVAIDIASDEVVLTANTPQELHEHIQAPRVAVMRAPREDESGFVWWPMGPDG